MGPGRRGGNGRCLWAARAECRHQQRLGCPRRGQRAVGTIRDSCRSQPLGMGAQRPWPDRRRHHDLTGLPGRGPERRRVAVHRRRGGLGRRHSHARPEVRRQRLGVGHQRIRAARRRHDDAADSSGQSPRCQRTADWRCGDRGRRRGWHGAPSGRHGLDVGQQHVWPAWRQHDGGAPARGSGVGTAGRGRHRARVGTSAASRACGSRARAHRPLAR